MNGIMKLFHIDMKTREGTISGVSFLNIAVKLIIALFKIVVGALASSIAIISEGVNNATDALSSVLTFIGNKLANKKRDAEHPFGHGRVEYLTSLAVSVIILVSGAELLIDAVKLVIHPEELKISYFSLAVVAVTAVIKFLMGNYTIAQGKRVGSDGLEAIGTDCRNDSFISLTTIVSALTFLLFGLSIDAFAGIITSVMVIKAGYEILSRTISELLGQPVDRELANRLYSEIRSTEGVLNAVDLVLHNYGPETYSGSCNLEIDHDRTVGEIYDVLHALQLKIFSEYHIAMTFGIYAVDKDSDISRKLHQQIADYVKEHEHIRSYHAVYFDEIKNRIYCDLVVDFEINDFDAAIRDFVSYLQPFYPDSEIMVNIDTEFVS